MQIKSSLDIININVSNAFEKCFTFIADIFYISTLKHISEFFYGGEDSCFILEAFCVITQKTM
jgi:hypothetical protein